MNSKTAADLYQERTLAVWSFVGKCDVIATLRSPAQAQKELRQCLARLNEQIAEFDAEIDRVHKAAAAEVAK